MRKEVFMAGTGGQGVLLVGQILTQAAVEEGLEVSWFPIYSPEVRGGSTTCTVVMADQRVGSPIAGWPSVVVLMDQMAANTNACRAKPGGTILINSSLVSHVEREDVRIVALPATAKAAEIGDERVANMVMLGAYVELFQAVSMTALEQAMQTVLPERHHRMLPLNMKALEAGAALAKELG